MDVATIKRLGTGFVPIVALFVLLLISLYLMSAATQNSEQFGRVYFGLLLINILGLVTLVVLIGANMIRLVRQYRNRAAGSRLTVRLVMLFSVLALVPVSVLYYFSLQFIQRGIDSWLDVRIEHALDDALELSRASLDARKRDLLRRVDLAAGELQRSAPAELSDLLYRLRQRHGAEELTLMTRSGKVVAFSSADSTVLTPTLPDDLLMKQVGQETSYIGLDQIGDAAMYMRVLRESGVSGPLGEPYLLQALFAVSDRMSVLAGSVQATYAEYRKVTLLRDPLKFSFTLTLSLVLLLSLLSAVWAAFFSARRLVAPIRVLAIGTRAVAGGDYSKRLPEHSHDELGFLVRSFNEMTHRIASTTAEAERSRQQVERERAYLRAVLGKLSSGVLTLDNRGRVRTANSAAGHVLGVEARELVGKSLQQFAALADWLLPFAERIRPHLEMEQGEWRDEVRFFGPDGQHILTCAGSPLAAAGGRSAGHVMVFEDVTALVQAQRDAAWGEVARRLAHEIKNPLTPIQLSAERLRHKYLPRMDEQEGEVLDRLTHTIVQQVAAMKEMVKAFSDYAHAPQLVLQPLQLNAIVEEVALLYRDSDPAVRCIQDLASGLPQIAADDGRLRQLLHNLIKNALEALAGRDGTMAGEVRLVTRHVNEQNREKVELRVEDNGPGIPRDMLEHIFEPYVTMKPKGSGLGLAVVKKIVEEHNGMVWVHNNHMGGATVTVQFPTEAMPEQRHGRQGGSATVEEDMQ